VALVLLKAGADVNAVDYKRRSALMAAVRCTNIATVQLLLDHGADIHLRDSAGTDALMGAAAEGQVGIMELLV
jgi:uncharacterized protein